MIDRVVDFDAAYRRKRFEEIRERVKRGAISDFAAAFACTLGGIELDLRRANALSTPPEPVGREK